MAGERILPGLGLYAFWTLGSDGWKDQNDTNLLKLSALAQPVVQSFEAALPGAPVNGDIHIATAIWGGGAAQDIMLYDNGGWVPITPSNGWSVYDEATASAYRFNGTSWVSESGKIIVEDSTGTDHILVDDDMTGRKIIERSNAAAQTVTVNTGLTNLQPVTVIKSGAGALTFVPGAGVTFRSAGTILATQHTSATIIPKSSTLFYIVGALT